MPLDVNTRRPNGAGVRADQEGVGTARIFCFHSIAFSPKETLHGRVVDVRIRDRLPPESGWSFLLCVIHADGASGGAADEGRRHTLHHDLLRQPDAWSKTITSWAVAKAGLEGRCPLYRGRTGHPNGHPWCTAISAGAAGDARGVLGFPEFDELMDKAQTTAPSAKSREHRRRWCRDGVPGARSARS